MIAKQLMMSSENSLRACLLFLEILLPLANLFTNSSDYDAWLNNVVAYMIPFDPRPEMDRSASPFRYIRS